MRASHSQDPLHSCAWFAYCRTVLRTLPQTSGSQEASKGTLKLLLVRAEDGTGCADRLAELPAIYDGGRAVCLAMSIHYGAARAHRYDDDFRVPNAATLMPFYATHVLHVGPGGLDVMMAASGPPGLVTRL